jgi:hypothetical protein
VRAERAELGLRGVLTGVYREFVQKPGDHNTAPPAHQG